MNEEGSNRRVMGAPRDGFAEGRGYRVCIAPAAGPRRAGRGRSSSPRDSGSTNSRGPARLCPCCAGRPAPAPPQPAPPGTADGARRRRERQRGGWLWARCSPRLPAQGPAGPGRASSAALEDAAPVPGSSSGKPGALRVGARPPAGAETWAEFAGGAWGKGRVALPQGATGRSRDGARWAWAEVAWLLLAEEGAPASGLRAGVAPLPRLSWISRPRGPGSALELG